MAAERGSISIDALSKSLDATTIEPSNDRTEQHGDVETKAKKLTVSSEFDGAVVFITGAASGTQVSLTEVQKVNIHLRSLTSCYQALVNFPPRSLPPKAVRNYSW